MNIETKRAKAKLEEVQEKINSLKEEEKEAKIEFLKALELGEEYMDGEGDKFLFVGFQIKPEPVALVEWPGGVNTMSLDCIKENFLSFNEFCEKEDREAEDTYPCPVCKRDIPATEPFCRDCMNDIKSKAA